MSDACFSVPRRAVLLIMLMLSLVMCDSALASTAGGTQVLPFEGWLMALQKSLTGPVAACIALIGIVGAGASLIFAGGQMNSFTRSMIYIVFVMTLLLGANSLITDFFNGALV